ncbi:MULTISPECIES: histidine phosphatase family protein [Marinovum]|uniref:histidine phosphatase family protein n=1 Tax=Marinovum TaxID=367771 RepID=UPI00237C07D5|nr:histidine phosphatase family protein [Marinovum sp. PR37]MDD9743270.1 histidine phosphatase family protein [Marinovum sp. PR37]
MNECEEQTRQAAAKPGVAAELILLRHAPVATPGRLCGRSDPSAALVAADIARLRAALPLPGRVVTSPARRCRQTAAALWPAQAAQPDARLWEQDFGAHEGLPYDALPDLGPMSGADLAQYAPPGGESFADLCARVAPALAEHGQAAAQMPAPLVLVVHAGVIRAALSQVTGLLSAGLAFEVATLSATRLRCGPEGPVSVIGANLA